MLFCINEYFNVAKKWLFLPHLEHHGKKWQFFATTILSRKKAAIFFRENKNINLFNIKKQKI